MEPAHSDSVSGARRFLRGASAIGALVTGVFGWLGSVATIFTKPPMEGAVFIGAAALAFGLVAIAAFRS
jgi:hypothetical protein